MDLLAQAVSMTLTPNQFLLTDDAAYGRQVSDAVEKHLENLSRSKIAGASWAHNGGIVVAPRTEFAEIINLIAPEHLELAISEPEEISAKVRHAGAIFMGNNTPEAVGDYVGGPNHVLPTSGSARFSSGLSVFDFLKRSTLLTCTIGSLKLLGPVAATLADAEGLSAHAASVRMRLDGGDSDRG
jgi:Histidinol dehydrogenase